MPTLWFRYIYEEKKWRLQWLKSSAKWLSHGNLLKITKEYIHQWWMRHKKKTIIPMYNHATYTLFGRDKNTTGFFFIYPALFTLINCKSCTVWISALLYIDMGKKRTFIFAAQRDQNKWKQCKILSKNMKMVIWPSYS